MTLRALDLFCCEGGVSTGLVNAGFDVTGVDVEPQPRYPYRFIQADALEFDLRGFDFVWASPPCQAFSRVTPRDVRASKVDLIDRVRRRLVAWGGPWVIENVPGAPIRPDLKLHGRMFDLPMHRDRWFESNLLLLAPSTRRYARDGATHRSLRKAGAWTRAGNAEMICMAGAFTGAPRARAALGMPWASRYGLAQCIPPQFAEFIGRQVLGGASL